MYSLCMSKEKIRVTKLSISCMVHTSTLDINYSVQHMLPLIILSNNTNCFFVSSAFVPLQPPPSQNSTQWDKVQYLFKELGSSGKCTLFKTQYIIHEEIILVLFISSPVLQTGYSIHVNKVSVISLVTH